MYSDGSIDFQASCFNFIDLFDHVIQKFASQKEHISFSQLYHERISELPMSGCVYQLTKVHPFGWQSRLFYQSLSYFLQPPGFLQLQGKAR